VLCAIRDIRDPTLSFLIGCGYAAPWESINKYFRKNTFTELYQGFAYISTGERE
jgi:hypothetical protein